MRELAFQQFQVGLKLDHIRDDARRLAQQQVRALIGVLFFLGVCVFSHVRVLAPVRVHFGGNAFGFEQRRTSILEFLAFRPPGFLILHFFPADRLEQRYTGFAFPFVVGIDITLQPVKFLVADNPFLVPVVCNSNQVIQVARRLETGRVDAGPGQGIVHGPLTVFLRIAKRGETDVRLDASRLRGAAVHTEKLGHGDLQLAHARLV